MSFAEIMREQEDERVARQLQLKYHNTEQRDPYWDQLELARKLSLEEAQPSSPSQPSLPLFKEQCTDEDMAYAQQLQDDELLANHLQIEERRMLPHDEAHPKYLTSLEYKLYNLQFGVDDPNRPQDPGDEEEYNYIEPYKLENNPNQIDPPILYDHAQRKEDKEISHVTKRTIEKRVNAKPIALHHKDYNPRNKGKAVHEQKQKKVHNQLLPKMVPVATVGEITIPIKDKEHDYGLVTKVLGGGHFLVFCYSDCSKKLCRIVGKMKYQHTWILTGDIILLKCRDYQKEKGDIIHKYSVIQYNSLLNLGELQECDPRKKLTPDLYQKLLSYLNEDDRKALQQVYEYN